MENDAPIITSVGFWEFSRKKTDGTEITDFNFPFDMWFVPNPDLAALLPDERQYDANGREVPFYEQLQ